MRKETRTIGRRAKTRTSTITRLTRKQREINKKNKQKEKKIYTILSFFVIIKLYHFRESRYREKNIYFY